MVERPKVSATRALQESVEHGRAFLARLAAPDAARIPDYRVAIVVAHPDDETIGAGGQLSRLGDPVVVHVTTGATRRDPERSAHASVRRHELEMAMALAGIPARSCLRLDIADQEAAFQRSCPVEWCRSGG